MPIGPDARRSVKMARINRPKLLVYNFFGARIRINKISVQQCCELMAVAPEASDLGAKQC